MAYLTGPDLIFEFANEDYRRAVGLRDLIGRPYREALPEFVGSRYLPERLREANVLGVVVAGEEGIQDQRRLPRHRRLHPRRP